MLPVKIRLWLDNQDGVWIPWQMTRRDETLQNTDTNPISCSKGYERYEMMAATTLARKTSSSKRTLAK
jgi:hypothetical protein